MLVNSAKCFIKISLESLKKDVRRFYCFSVDFSLISPGTALERGELVSASGLSTANQNYFNLSTGNFTHNWSNTGLITVNDDWGGVPSIEGYLGQGLTTTTAVDPQTVLGTSTAQNDLDVIAIIAVDLNLLAARLDIQVADK